jgi:catechol 2,3-dioxygenase-like lactoylglutathione lyase family enzyme
MTCSPRKEIEMIKPNSAFPVFIVKHLHETKTFYTKYFGFDVAFENEWYLHLLTETGIQVGFLLPDQPSQPDIFHKACPGEGVIFSLEVENADTAYTEAQGNSLDIVLELRSEDWGQRHFCVRDPNGVYLDVVQAIEPTGEYTQNYVAE